MHQIKKDTEPIDFTRWKNDFQTIYGRNPVYDDLKATTEYWILKKHLVEEQGYICCYCEREIGKLVSLTDCNVEHFKPRHPAKNLPLTPEQRQECIDAQLDYNNLYASCLGEKQYYTDHCNHKKDNWYDFEVCVLLTDSRINDLFGYRLSGKMFAIGSNAKAQEFLNHLNLDSYALREQRKNAYDAIIEEEFVEDELWRDREYIADTITYYRHKHDGKYHPFCSMIAYCLEHYAL